MSKITEGSIVSTRKWHIMLFQTKRAALRALANIEGQPLHPEYDNHGVATSHFSAPLHVKKQQLQGSVADYFDTWGVRIHYAMSDTPMMVLEVDKENHLYKVLSDNFVGWMFNFSWFEFRKMKSDKVYAPAH